MSSPQTDPSSHLTTIAIGGLPADEWNRLSSKLFGLVDTMTSTLTSRLSPAVASTASTVTEDVTALAVAWTKAKLDKPSLENELLRADIALKFEQAKKTAEETRGLQQQREIKEMEAIMNLATFIQSLRVYATFNHSGTTGHLIVGPPGSEVKMVSLVPEK